MRYFCVLIVVFCVCQKEVWAIGLENGHRLQEDHFTLVLPKDFSALDPGALPPSGFPDTVWGRVYERRIKDLDRVFVAQQADTFLFLGIKVHAYRRQKGKALPYDEFANEQNIEGYKMALTAQLQREGLLQVSVHGFTSEETQKTIRFTCRFESPEGLKGEEYYVSILGNREIVYLVLFSSPPAVSVSRASVFQQIVSSFEFGEKYGYDSVPRNWWARRTWGERIEDVLKLTVLFAIVYFGSSRALRWSVGRKWRPPAGVVRAIGIFVSSLVCLAVLKWVPF